MLKFKSILIVDDDAVSVFITRKAIQKAELTPEIFSACNGAEALEFIEEFYNDRKELPELILVDINMPVMNGMELISEIKGLPYYNPDNVTLAVVSTSSNLRDLEELKDLGVTYVFQKPILQEYLRQLRMLKPGLREKIESKENPSARKAG